MAAPTEGLLKKCLSSEYPRDRMAPDSSAVGFSMSNVVLNISRLPPDDRRAMAAYLKTLPPRQGSKPIKK